MPRPESHQETRQSAVGLCLDCYYRKQITSGKGSEFFYCLRSETDATYVKYPRLPVVECAGYKQQRESSSG